MIGWFLRVFLKHCNQDNAAPSEIGKGDSWGLFVVLLRVKIISLLQSLLWDFVPRLEEKNDEQSICKHIVSSLWVYSPINDTVI